jgi:nucleotidyltransferase substrate binding protein (TIGR01987 family)
MGPRLSLLPLRQAHASLRDAIEAVSVDPDNDLMRDGLIQRFEFLYEMAWKTMKRYLEAEHYEEAADQWSRRDLYRIAAETGLIGDPQDWFEFMMLRNLSSHTYNKQTAQRVAAAVPDFASACERLITVLAKRLDDAAPDTD